MAAIVDWKNNLNKPAKDTRVQTTVKTYIFYKVLFVCNINF